MEVFHLSIIKCVSVVTNHNFNALNISICKWGNTGAVNKISASSSPIKGNSIVLLDSSVCVAGNLWCPFFCSTGFSCSYLATVAPRCFHAQLFSYSDSAVLFRIKLSSPKCQLHLFVSKRIISFASLGKASAQIIFLVTHFVISSISQLNIFSADSSFI